jgi:hypothetical protein
MVNCKIWKDILVAFTAEGISICLKADEEQISFK